MNCEKLVNTITLNGIIENEVLDVCVDEHSCSQYLGIQHLEEHYYPSALSFGNFHLKLPFYAHQFNPNCRFNRVM